MRAAKVVLAALGVVAGVVGWGYGGGLFALSTALWALVSVVDEVTR